MKRLVGVVLLGVLAATFVACGADDDDPSSPADVSSNSSGIAGSFVGSVEGSDAFIGIVVLQTREALAYVCDGKGLSQWFRGTAGANDFNVDTDGAELRARMSLDGASGTVRLAGGVAMAFEADPARGKAGLYRATGEGPAEALAGGWIVREDGQQRGSVTVRNTTTGVQELVLDALIASVEDSRSAQEEGLAKVATQNAQAEQLSDQISTLTAALKTGTPVPAAPMVVRGVVLHPAKLTSASSLAALK
jgi:hypothetical protein